MNNNHPFADIANVLRTKRVAQVAPKPIGAETIGPMQTSNVQVGAKTPPQTTGVVENAQLADPIKPAGKPGKSGMEAVRPRMEQQIRAMRECFGKGDFDLAKVHATALVGIFEALHINPRRAQLDKLVVAHCPECSHFGPVRFGQCGVCSTPLEVE